MAWSALVPTDDGLLINAPGQIRANWDAIALGTDSALLITNAKCASDMALQDSKLAQITTAGKLSGSAFTLLPNIPAAAGLIPLPNLGGGTPDNTKFLCGDQVFKQIDLTTHITGLLPLANMNTVSAAKGGTGSTSAVNTANGAVILTAAGKYPALDGSLITGITSTGFYVGIITKNAADASTTTDYTGVGFTPKAVLFFMSSSSSTQFSNGVDDGTRHKCTYQANIAGTLYYHNTMSINFEQVGGNIHTGYVSAFGADGFTITWTKNSSPTGTFYVVYLALK